MIRPCRRGDWEPRHCNVCPGHTWCKVESFAGLTRREFICTEAYGRTKGILKMTYSSKMTRHSSQLTLVRWAPLCIIQVKVSSTSPFDNENMKNAYASIIAWKVTLTFHLASEHSLLLSTAFKAQEVEGGIIRRPISKSVWSRSTQTRD
jgi:hypothetical protein